MIYQRKNPLAQAKQYTGENAAEIEEFIGDSFYAFKHFTLKLPIWVVKNNGTERIETYSDEFFHEVFEPVIFESTEITENGKQDNG